ncbi:hypothetical protein MMC11_007390 [Xylographa trunciseda]|nr:hypothetical protein [Xylographa trunciseda]
MPGQPTTQQDREQITARLFRREPVPDIARTTGISKKTIWRISYNLKTYGTAVAPKEPKTRGRPPLLTQEEHEALAQFILDNPIAIREDMVDFVRDRFGKEVNNSCVTHAIKRMGFTRIIIMRGLWATRHDLPPEAARVHHIAAEAIERQMRVNAEQKAELVRQGNPAVAQNKGRYAWVRLHPGEDTGINPRTTNSTKRRLSKEAASENTTTNSENSALEIIFSETVGTGQNSPQPDFQALQQYVSPYV